MEKKAENLENFKKAITSTIKSITGDQNINVTFGNSISNKNINIVNLPNIQSVNNKIDYTKTRALADTEALKLRCSDINIYNSYEPEGNIAKLLYAVAEKIRYEKIGSSYFKGIGENLNRYYKVKNKQKNDYKNNDYEFVDAFENYLRNQIFKLNNDKETENKYKKYKKKLDSELKNKLDSLSNSIFDQKKFNLLISKIISQIQIDENINSEKNEDQKNEDNLENKSNEKNEKDSQEDSNNSDNVDNNFQDLDQSSSEIKGDIEADDEKDQSLNSPKANREKSKNFGDSQYKYYTQEFDEIIAAEELENEEELLRLRQNLDHQLLSLKNFISKLANKLQRKL